MTERVPLPALVDVGAEIERRLGPTTLITVLGWNEQVQTFVRLYSSNAELSEPGTAKNGSVSSDWFTWCIVKQRSFLGSNDDAIRATYSEHAELLAAGCHCSMNVPVTTEDGTTVGVVNVFGGAGAYDCPTLTKLQTIVRSRQPAISRAVTRASATMLGLETR